MCFSTEAAKHWEMVGRHSLVTVLILTAHEIKRSNENKDLKMAFSKIRVTFRTKIFIYVHLLPLIFLKEKKREMSTNKTL